MRADILPLLPKKGGEKNPLLRSLSSRGKVNACAEVKKASEQGKKEEEHGAEQRVKNLTENGQNREKRKMREGFLARFMIGEKEWRNHAERK